MEVSQNGVFGPNSYDTGSSGGGYHTHSLGRMSERGEALSVCERETEDVEIIFMFLGFTASIGAHSISKEVVGFSPLWFPRGKFFVSLVFCILLMYMLFSQLKILRS